MVVLETIGVAFAMFSALPVPRIDWNERNMRYAMAAFPLIGAVIGALWCVCGALPLPDDRGAMKHFLEALTWHTDCGDCIMIYPEAHIWPFYTGIRPFPDTSFRYPVQQKLPVFCLTNTYQRRGKSHIPQIVTYLDGPFYPDAELPAKLQKTQLRDQVYEAMGKRAKNSNMEMIRYIKKDTDREKSFI